MRQLRLSIMLASLQVVALAGMVNAQVPQHLNHQGILTNNAGVIVPDGAYELEFQIYTTPSAGGTPLFQQQLTANVVKGLYNVLLSDNAEWSLTDAFDGATRYLQLRIVTSPGNTYNNLVLSPRQQIASVPYALVAGRVVDEVAPPAIGSLACRNTHAVGTNDTYGSTAWVDALVSCAVTVPGEGYVIVVHGALFADNDGGVNYLLGRIRENCGGATTTVAFGFAPAYLDNTGEESDLAYVPMSFTRTTTQPAQTCTYTIEGRSAYGGTSSFDRNAGGTDDADDFTPTGEVVTSIDAVALPTR